MVDDATIFKALSRTAKNGALICLHAENGGIIDVIVRRAVAEGKTAPIYHGLRAPLPQKRKRFIVPWRCQKFPARLFTSCIFHPKQR